MQPPKVHHAAKQPPCQVALRQGQPVVAGVFNQTAPVFTSSCSKLVSDQLATAAGSAGRRIDLSEACPLAFPARQNPNA